MNEDRIVALGLVFLFGVAVGTTYAEHVQLGQQGMELDGEMRPQSPTGVAPAPLLRSTYCPREQYGRSLKAVIRHAPDRGFWYYSCYFGKQTRKDVL